MIWLVLCAVIGVDALDDAAFDLELRYLRTLERLDDGVPPQPNDGAVLELRCLESLAGGRLVQDLAKMDAPQWMRCAYGP